MKQELPSVDLSSGKRRYLFWSNTKMALGRKIRSHRSENGKKIMGEDPQSLENKGFSQISQLVLHSMLSDQNRYTHLETPEKSGVSTVSTAIFNVRFIDIQDCLKIFRQDMN